MKVFAHFSVKAVGLDDCSSVDLSKYSYVMRFCSARQRQNVLKVENTVSLSKEGQSQVHSFEYSDDLSEAPLVWCDINCGNTITDNEWTVFKKKFSAGETTKNSSYDKICEISNHRVFIDPQFPVGDPNDPFEKSKIERQLNRRLAHLSSAQDWMFYIYPDQGESSLCGPAVFLYALLKDRPDLYSQYVKDLWNQGSANLGAITIAPSQGCCHPKKFTKQSGETRVPAIDWISMASLRDNENLMNDYSSPDDEFSGVTLPSSIEKWVGALGCEVIYKDMSVLSYPKYKVSKLNDYVDPDNHVAVLINDGLLNGNPGNVATHWILWEGKLMSLSSGLPADEKTPDTDLVDLQLFSWGRLEKLSSFRLSKICSLKEFVDCIYGAVVFKKNRV